jgi:1-acyl-sn-glycerol-3-phosphate acyltransferase
LPFHANLFEAAIDARAMVQPIALAYLDDEGSWHPSVDYVGATTFVDSILRILGGPPMSVRLHYLAPMPSEGAHRRELARAAQQAIAGALGLVQDPA